MSGLMSPGCVGPRLEKCARYTPFEWFGAPGAAIGGGASPEFPAATTTTLPAATALSPATLRASVPSDGKEVPRLIEITSTSGAAAHQSIPATIPLVVPDPCAFRTFPAQRPAPGATPPNRAADGPPTPSPTAIDATCVPWP